MDNHYQIIPDDITTKIIQGLGSKVFTKVFRIAVPHNAYEEVEKDGLEFEVAQEVNFGDVSMYKCSSNMYGDKVSIYLLKEKEIERGSKIMLKPVIEKCEIYESELNIRLY